jgi:hypothetical protein
VGDVAEVQKRLNAINDLAVLEITRDAETLAHSILESGAIPPRAIRDAAHIAVATVHAVDYLLTWNCKHLANAQILRRIESLCRRAGWQMPIICTPEELMGD